MAKLSFVPLLLIVWSGTVLAGQSAPAWESCPVIATMPADLSSAEPVRDRQRFELRQCYGDHVVITGYGKRERRPSLVFDTGDGYPRYLAHCAGVLVFQSTGGASDHVYVFAFKSGKPSVGLKTATKGLIQVKQTESAVIVLVPPTTYPGSDGQPRPQPPDRKYIFTIEH